ncbi:tRNA dimethylallyltransferase [Striga asiatica]|uniref:tRNA dimethylallyltransferase n=1 Tax=Striga asiatica TaxID=4170 RepID=A0A5A7QHC1_STRAF|nr:tRNA dimethylallyltransferase [Striga asiatica]
MLDCTATTTPLPCGLKLQSGDSQPLTEPDLYRRIIGRPLYLNLIRPYITYGVQQLSQFVNEPCSSHWHAAMHILRYLKGTADHGIYFSKTGSFTLSAYSDVGILQGHKKVRFLYLFLCGVTIRRPSIFQQIRCFMSAQNISKLIVTLFVTNTRRGLSMHAATKIQLADLIVKNKVVIVMGPIGAGKSRLFIDLATRFEGEIINSDKIQVYKGLNIVTNKVTNQECHKASHHLLGIIESNSDFSVNEFIEHATMASNAIVHHGKLPIIAGGSNSCIKALVNDSLEFRAKYECCFLCVDVDSTLVLRSSLVVGLQGASRAIAAQFLARFTLSIELGSLAIMGAGAPHLVDEAEGVFTWDELQRFGDSFSNDPFDLADIPSFLDIPDSVLGRGVSLLTGSGGLGSPSRGSGNHAALSANSGGHVTPSVNSGNHTSSLTDSGESEASGVDIDSRPSPFYRMSSDDIAEFKKLCELPTGWSL